MQVYRDGESAPDLTREPEMGNTGGRKMYYHSVQVCYLPSCIVSCQSHFHGCWYCFVFLCTILSGIFGTRYFS